MKKGKTTLTATISRDERRRMKARRSLRAAITTPTPSRHLSDFLDVLFAFTAFEASKRIDNFCWVWFALREKHKGVSCSPLFFLLLLRSILSSCKGIHCMLLLCCTTGKRSTWFPGSFCYAFMRLGLGFGRYFHAFLMGTQLLGCERKGFAFFFFFFPMGSMDAAACMVPFRFPALHSSGLRLSGH